MKIGEMLGVKEHQLIELNLDKIVDHRSDTSLSYGAFEGKQLIFLSYGIAYANRVGAETVSYGANLTDYNRYVDCRLEFIQSFGTTIRFGTQSGVNGNLIRIDAPFIYLNKTEIAREALMLGVPIDETWDCIKDQERPCGECVACLTKQKAIEEAGNIVYRE